ncbi:GNAT family N-acetyltransferase [Yoonia sp.]|uniref:GNAT family N-acetyltransferase n=1 Tax=Yoonia sp. TaxID=2212373 RepID=UPI003A4DD102|nr:GNAT family N-acetyltransferase [Loktanella sp.]
MFIRELHLQTDLAAVHAFYCDAPDYWIMADGVAPDLAKARSYFHDCPPNCDPTKTHRLGLFLDDRLSGLGELSFGFPATNDAYLGFMMLGPWARNAGHGSEFLAHFVNLAQQAGASSLYLAVLDVNQAGRRFWDRHGFQATDVSGTNAQGLGLTRMCKSLGDHG